MSVRATIKDETSSIREHIRQMATQDELLRVPQGRTEDRGQKMTKSFNWIYHQQIEKLS